MLSVESLPEYVKITCAHVSSAVHVPLHEELYKNLNYQSGFLVLVVFNHSHKHMPTRTQLHKAYHQMYHW